MIDLSYEGSPKGLMEYLKEAEYELSMKETDSWSDRPEYDSNGEPNE
jgi:hypothetical protein